MDSQKLSLVLNAVLVLVIIVIVAYGLKEGNFGGASKESLESDYIAIDLYNQRDSDAKRLQQQIFQRDSQIYALNEKIKELESQIGIDGVCQEPQKSSSNYEPKIQQQIKEEKPVATLTCSNHLMGSHFIPVDCQERVLEFIETHKDASKFNLIGIVDTQDFAVIEGLKNSSEQTLEKLNINQFHIDQLKVIAPLGLARARAKEAMQLIKRELGKDTQVVQASYELILEDRRGFVLQVFE